MDPIHLIVLAVLALIGGGFIFDRLKYGSWAGASLKGSIGQTYGEVLLSHGVSGSQVVKIVELKDSEGQALVGLVITTKAILGANIAPYRLSKDQARELSGLLAQASKEVA